MQKENFCPKLGTLNVQAMTPSFVDDPREIDNACKAAVIDMELSRLQLAIVALQETRQPDSRSFKETFHSSGRENQVRPGNMESALLSGIPC